MIFHRTRTVCARYFTTERTVHQELSRAHLTLRHAGLPVSRLLLIRGWSGHTGIWRTSQCVVPRLRMSVCWAAGCSLHQRPRGMARSALTWTVSDRHIVSEIPRSPCVRSAESAGNCSCLLPVSSEAPPLISPKEGATANLGFSVRVPEHFVYAMQSCSVRCICTLLLYKVCTVRWVPDVMTWFKYRAFISCAWVTTIDARHVLRWLLDELPRTLEVELYPKARLSESPGVHYNEPCKDGAHLGLRCCVVQFGGCFGCIYINFVTAAQRYRATTNCNVQKY
jgi:hypothetical protein